MKSQTFGLMILTFLMVILFLPIREKAETAIPEYSVFFALIWIILTAIFASITIYYAFSK